MQKIILALLLCLLLIPVAEARPDDPLPERDPWECAPTGSDCIKIPKRSVVTEYDLKVEDGASVIFIHFSLTEPETNFFAVLNKATKVQYIYTDVFQISPGPFKYRFLGMERFNGLTGLWICEIDRHGNGHLRYFSRSGQRDTEEAGPDEFMLLDLPEF